MLSTTFAEYRTLVFKTTPFDDYSEYVVYIATLGAEGKIPVSPFKERILSIVPAAGLYKALPAIHLTNATGVSDSFLKASFAIAFMNTLAFLLAAATVFFVAARLVSDETVALLSSVFLLLCASYIHMTGVDGVAIFVISLILLLHANGSTKALIATLLASALINEKILIFSIGYFSVFAVSNRRDALVWAASLLAFVAYLLVRKHYGVGSEEQLNVGNFFGAFIATAQTSFTVKGLYLNVFPLFVSLVPIFLLLLGRKNTDSSKPVIACLLALAGLLFASMTSNVVYNVGRLIMYTAPVVAVFVAVLFDTDAKARLGA